MSKDLLSKFNPLLCIYKYSCIMLLSVQLSDLCRNSSWFLGIVVQFQTPLILHESSGMGSRMMCHYQVLWPSLYGASCIFWFWREHQHTVCIQYILVSLSCWGRKMSFSKNRKEARMLRMSSGFGTSTSRPQIDDWKAESLVQPSAVTVSLLTF